MVPTLVNGDEVVTDSLVIMRYVAERFEGPSLIPEDPVERERMEHWYALAESLDFRLFTFSSVPPRIISFGLGKKLKKLRAYAKKYPELRAEYEAKIEDISGLKEQSRDPQRIERQRADVNREFDALDEVLAEHHRRRELLPRDVIWTVSLTRLTPARPHRVAPQPRGLFPAHASPAQLRRRSTLT